MDKEEIIRRLKKISKHAVHTVGEPSLILSLDDGIALDDAVRLLEEQEAIIKGLGKALEEKLRVELSEEQIEMLKKALALYEFVIDQRDEYPERNEFFYMVEELSKIVGTDLHP